MSERKLVLIDPGEFLGPPLPEFKPPDPAAFMDDPTLIGMHFLITSPSCTELSFPKEAIHGDGDTFKAPFSIHGIIRIPQIPNVLSLHMETNSLVLLPRIRGEIFGNLNFGCSCSYWSCALREIPCPWEHKLNVHEEASPIRILNLINHLRMLHGRLNTIIARAQRLGAEAPEGGKYRAVNIATGYYA